MQRAAGRDSTTRSRGREVARAAPRAASFSPFFFFFILPYFSSFSVHRRGAAALADRRIIYAGAPMGMLSPRPTPTREIRDCCTGFPGFSAAVAHRYVEVCNTTRVLFARAVYGDGKVHAGWEIRSPLGFADGA